MKKSYVLPLLLAASAMVSCSAGGTQRAASPTAATQARPADAFSADSAYALVAEQVAMGPRTPGSEASARCAEWMAGKLRAAGADSVWMQRGTVRRFDGEELPACNILASFRPDAPRRILLAAHYDTRPWADMEADPAMRCRPIPGANDGASGVAVVLEIARCIGAAAPSIGVDILLADAEDSGHSDIIAPGVRAGEHTWCLGTQMWAESEPYASRPAPAYAVLFDMVGGTGARFLREQFSDAAAARIVDRIWAEAASLGYSDTFVDRTGGAVVDDHVYISRAGIPAVDIIESLHPATGGFPPSWHTHSDNIDNIDPRTLERAGKTVLSLIYKEK